MNQQQRKYLVQRLDEKQAHLIASINVDASERKKNNTEAYRTGVIALAENELVRRNTAYMESLHKELEMA